MSRRARPGCAARLRRPGGRRFERGDDRVDLGVAEIRARSARPHAADDGSPPGSHLLASMARIRTRDPSAARLLARLITRTPSVSADRPAGDRPETPGERRARPGRRRFGRSSTGLRRCSAAVPPSWLVRRGASPRRWMRRAQRPRPPSRRPRSFGGAGGAEVARRVDSTMSPVGKSIRSPSRHAAQAACGRVMETLRSRRPTNRRERPRRGVAAGTGHAGDFEARFDFGRRRKASLALHALPRRTRASSGSAMLAVMRRFSTPPPDEPLQPGWRKQHRAADDRHDAHSRRPRRSGFRRPRRDRFARRCGRRGAQQGGQEERRGAGWGSTPRSGRMRQNRCTRHRALSVTGTTTARIGNDPAAPQEELVGHTVHELRVGIQARSRSRRDSSE